MDWIDEYLKNRRKAGLLRELSVIDKVLKGRVVIREEEYIDFSSNDYLGLREHPKLSEAGYKMAERFGAGSCASRLMSGNLSIHKLLEEKIAKFKGKEAALVYNSGYQANIGVISAIFGPKDVIFSDRLNHASIVDGIKLSGARLYRFAHNDMNHLEDLLKRHRGENKASLIITESIFSMDGDRAPLKDIIGLKQRFDSMLMVDEAHATGIFGKSGSGVCEDDNIVNDVDIIMGTFGKALGSFGAYIAGSENIISFLINSSRSFIYSTSLPPFVVGANIAAIKIVENEGKERRETLLNNAAFFRSELLNMGYDVGGCSQIIPVIVGENSRVIELSKYLLSNGLLVVPIRPPTVPKDTARLRFSITFNHKRKCLEDVIKIMARKNES